MCSILLSTWHHVENTRDSSCKLRNRSVSWSLNCTRWFVCCVRGRKDDIEDPLQDSKKVQASWGKKAFPDSPSRLPHDLEQGECEDRKPHPLPRASSSWSTQSGGWDAEAAQVFSRKPWLLAGHLLGIPASLALSSVQGWGPSVNPVTPASCKKRCWRDQRQARRHPQGHWWCRGAVWIGVLVLSLIRHLHVTF